MDFAKLSPGLAQHIFEVQMASQHGLPLLAIEGSLALIDICAALDNGGRTNRTRFKQWLEQNLPSYGTIDPADLYQLRCAALHEGKARGENYERIFFIPKNPAGLTMHHCIFDRKVYELSLEQFVDDICDAVIKWRTGLAKDITALEDNLLQTRVGGMAPRVQGVDVIA